MVIPNHARGDLKMDVGSFLTFADYFFDGIIADWMVQSKIGDALNQVREARRQVGGIRKRLRGCGGNGCR